MAFKSYLIEQFNYSHENIFFRQVSNNLKKEFENKEGLHILIGNLSCNGHQLDALFISKGKIIVIDFKNYGGKLIFSENNAWQIFPEGKESVFVKGGGSIRNPYQQVNAYRNSLIQLLENKQNKFTDKNHYNLNFRHIGGMVIFHNPIKFDIKNIPDKMQYYFDIVDNNTCIDRIKDKTSDKLQFSDDEIIKILKVLDIKEENLYDSSIEIEQYDSKKTLSNAVERLQMVKRLLENVEKTDSPIRKRLDYYEILLNLERQKEPKVSETYDFPISVKDANDVVNINLNDNEIFQPIFLKNKTEQFPKNIFVGINFSVNGDVMPLLYTIVQSRDLISNKEIEIFVKEFNLYAKPLEDRQYSDEDIESIANEISIKNTIQKKIEILEKYFEGIQLEENVSLALSEESSFTAQLLSEIKKIKKEELVKENSLLHQFLLNEPISNYLPKINEKYVQITPLNKEQKQAIKQSFSQPLSVITGPPGTGKTQVILNILANAILQNKKVLVASKNNQAVDNVKEKLNSLLKEPNFFLRFGSKTDVRANVVPIIKSFVSRIHHKNYDEISNEIQEKLDEKYRELEDFIKEYNNKEKLEKNIENYTEKIIQQIQKIETKRKDFQVFVENNEKLLNLSKDNSQRSKVEWIKAKNEIIGKSSGLNGLLFNWFSKKKYALELITSIEILDENLRKVIEQKGISVSLEKLSNANAIISTYTSLVKILDEVEVCFSDKNKLEKDIVAFQEELVILEEKLEVAKTDLEDHLAKEEEITQNIELLKKEIEALGIPLIDEKIKNKLVNADASIVNDYSDYIPDNVPWRNSEIPNFEKVARCFLSTFNTVAVTSLSVKTSLPLTTELFDIVVIDEASQCDIISAIPLILRAKQLVVIGDPMQLKHISKIQKYEQEYIQENIGLLINKEKVDYINKSLYDYCYDLSIDSKMNGTFLKEHYRCHPDIASYSNEYIYKPLLGQEIEILTEEEDFSIEPKGILWKNIKGQWHPERKQNDTEIEQVIILATELLEKNPNASIGITSPFRHQINAIKEKMPMALREKIKADVVHSFQGQERDIMIFSIVVTDQTPERSTKWINENIPYLINVAVTRARNTLYVVGDIDYCRKLGRGTLYELSKYVQENKIV